MVHTHATNPASCIKYKVLESLKHQPFTDLNITVEPSSIRARSLRAHMHDSSQTSLHIHHDLQVKISVACCRTRRMIPLEDPEGVCPDFFFFLVHFPTPLNPLFWSLFLVFFFLSQPPVEPRLLASPDGKGFPSSTARLMLTMTRAPPASLDAPRHYFCDSLTCRWPDPTPRHVLRPTREPWPILLCPDPRVC